MTRTILLLQLAFNIVMLAALAVLVWGRPRRARDRSRRAAGQVYEDATTAPPVIEEPNFAPSPAASVDAPESPGPRELTAEDDARARFSRFRDKAGS